ncbi:bifunctional pyridoxamine 5'-phosphate oxidase family protein/GNAT family N-acetyltransferase [Luedemannella helvata]|uniref:N-acetyltransferase domain-containing protein n=1 Tax=Luedemannella helvata TaxID=349315 RepID=A0ABN2KLW0_9ACTN
MTATYEQTSRTTSLRKGDRMTYDRAAAHAILDEAYHCDLSFVVPDPETGRPEPRTLPTLHARVGDTLYLHGSTGSRPMLAARADGLPVCVTVTHLDGLVLARSQFSHSANYRCVIAHGDAQLVTDPAEKLAALTAFVDKVAPGRARDSRPPDHKELAQTAVLKLPLVEVSVKARAGGPGDDPEDERLPHWAGVLPLDVKAGRPEPVAGSTTPVPDYLRPARSPWLTPATLRGDHVILEPLDVTHAAQLLAAIGDEEVFRWIPRPMPRDVDAMAELITEALAAHHEGTRVPWLKRCARTGEVVGTTSYYAPNVANRNLAIGYTMIGKRWWRTGINTEAKLLLLERAFEVLVAERVEWHTDLRNERSQAAIARLGATREGVLRHHLLRPDGSWRDSVLYAMTADEWPAARAALRSRLRPPARDE